MSDNPRPPLPPNQQLVRGDRWPVVGEKSPGAADDGSPWTITIDGLVSTPQEWTLAELLAMPLEEREIDLHCVTRWSKLGVPFGGVPLRALLDAASPTAEARYVNFVARTERRHSTSLPLDEVLRLDPLVAFTSSGAALTTEHGGPVRVVVPGKYFYKSVKWLTRIALLAEDELGYWEQEAGYHNRADPWREERFIASNLTLQQVRQLIASRDFTGQDLLGLQAEGQDLRGLKARDTLLRNANLRRADLRDADLCGANLSGAVLRQTDCRGANFTGCDLEGADFADADLRGADLRGASLFGASFGSVQPDGSMTETARLDASTRVEPPSLDALTEEQRAFVLQSVS